MRKVSPFDIAYRMQLQVLDTGSLDDAKYTQVHLWRKCQFTGANRSGSNDDAATLSHAEAAVSQERAAVSAGSPSTVRSS